MRQWPLTTDLVQTPTGRQQLALRDGQWVTYCASEVTKHTFNVFITCMSYTVYIHILNTWHSSKVFCDLFAYSSSTNHEQTQDRQLANTDSTEVTPNLGSINTRWSSSVVLQYLSWTSRRLSNLLSVKSFQCHWANLGMKAQFCNRPLSSTFFI